MSSEVQKTAYRMLSQYKLGVPSLDDLVCVAKDQGYDIIDYSKESSNPSVATLIKELSVEEVAKRGKAFVFQKKEIKLLFLSEEMNQDEKRYAIAHELGHIALGHLRHGTSNDTSICEEHDANEFTHYLLLPGKGYLIKHWINEHKTSCVVCIIVLAFAIGMITLRNYVRYRNSLYGEYYITENGSHYHKKDCIYIKDKTNVHRLSVEEYDSGKYEPCQNCMGGNEN